MSIKVGSISGDVYRSRWKIGMTFKLRDLWIGVYWENKYPEWYDLKIYVCIIPCVPIYFFRYWEEVKCHK